MKQSIPPETYDRDYFLSEICEGWEEFRQGRGVSYNKSKQEPAAQPVVLPNFRDRMPPYDTGVPGLLMANTTQVYPDDRGTNYAVREADEVVEALLRQGERVEAGRAAA